LIPLNFQRRGIEVASSPGIQDERVAREEERLIRRECGRATSAAADLKRLCIKNASIFETAAGALEAIAEALRNQDQINRDAWDNIKRGDVINGVVQ
jgi:hypothetical protein